MRNLSKVTLPAPQEPGEKPRRPPPELVSLVVPAFNESGNVEVVAQAVEAALWNQDYELIFVDDGSDDDTFERIVALARRNPKVCGLALSRNFGHQCALTAGFQGQHMIRLYARAIARPPFIVERIVRQAERSKPENVETSKRRNKETSK